MPTNRWSQRRAPRANHSQPYLSWFSDGRHPELSRVVSQDPKLETDLLRLQALQPFERHMAEVLSTVHHMFEVSPDLEPALKKVLASPEFIESIDPLLATVPTMLTPCIHMILQDPASQDALLHIFSTPELAREMLPVSDISTLLEGLVTEQPPIHAQYQVFLKTGLIRRMFWVAIIGNAVILVLICTIASIKYESLTLSKKLGERRISNAAMEKAMRRDISEEELQRHSLPGNLWMAVDGVVCDISDFVNVHPGGADLLLQHAGADATEHFREVGHSDFAGDLIKERIVGVLTQGGGAARHGEQNSAPSLAAQIRSAARTYLPAQLLALFTAEDRFNVHKALGVTVLVHYIVRFVLLLQAQWLLEVPGLSALHGRRNDPMRFGGDWFSLFSVWFCILLQVTSFQFVLPRNRVLGKPMLWQEWRAHNLIFVLRNLFAFTATWCATRWELNSWRSAVTIQCLRGCAIWFQLYMADVVTRSLRDSKHESLTASWPLWEGCPVWLERFLKFYYSVAINQLTNMVMNGGSMTICFAGIIILQSDSFAMTLVRKNIIKTETFHGFYLWNMWHVAFLSFHVSYVGLWAGHYSEYWVSQFLNLFTIPVAVYLARFCGLSKYGCWFGVLIKSILDITVDGRPRWTWFAIPAVWATWAVLQFSIAGFVFEFRVRRFLEGGRMKPMRLSSRERISRSLYFLRFDLPAGYACGMMPGQHVKLGTPNTSMGSKRWNGRDNLEVGVEVLSRSYTPISSPDATTVDVIVKHYPRDPDGGFPDGGRASAYLVEEMKAGDTILASGPHGHRIYFGNGAFEVQVGKPKVKPRVCAVLAGGSGITPALSVIREVQAEARRKANSSEAWRLLDFENAIAVEAFQVVHVNRAIADALPLSFYDDPQAKEQLVPVYVTNLVTGRADGAAAAGEAEPPPGAGAGGGAEGRWSVRRGGLGREAVAGSLAAPGEDVLVLVCGPHGFVVDTCQPLLKEMGYKHVIGMY